MIKYSVKEVQDVLKESEVVTSNADVCNELRIQVIAESAKDDDKRKPAFDSLHALYEKAQDAKKDFEKAVCYVLWQSGETFTKYANPAIDFAAQNVAHMRGLSKNFVKWAQDNGKLAALKEGCADVSSVAKIASLMADMIEDYQKTKEQADTQKAARRSAEERLAAKRAAAAAAMAEVERLEAELKESK